MASGVPAARREPRLCVSHGGTGIAYSEPVTNAMLPGLGGPMGRHARPEGSWFDPRGWLIVTGTGMFLVLMLRQLPCIQTSPNDVPDAVIRLCYADIPLSWTTFELGSGVSPLTGHETLMWAPLMALLLSALGAISRFGSPVSAGEPLDATAAAEVVLAHQPAYLGLTWAVLFVCFLVWVLLTMLMGRGGFGRYRTWDAMWIAASPVVLATGLIAWELFPIALCVLSLFLLTRRHILASGLVLGLAMSAASMPFAVLVAVTGALFLRRRIVDSLAFGGAAVVAFGLVNLPFLVLDADLVLGYYRGEIAGESSYGSLVYVAEQFGAPLRETGSLGFMILVIGLVIGFSWLYLTNREPRVADLLVLVIFGSMLTSPAYPPQMGLWLLFALVLSHPSRLVLGAFTVVQTIYWAAVWGWISGHLTAAQSGPQNLYFLSVLLRVAVDLWIMWRALQHTRGFKACEILDASELLPNDLVESRGRHAAGDRDLVTNGDQRV